MLTQSMTPNQISAYRYRHAPDSLRDRRDHRQNDEGDLEEIEEERQEEDEQVDENQKAPDAAGQRRQEMLQPDVAGDAKERDRETASIRSE